MASLDSLPADQRAVLQLVLQRGRSYDDIAELISIDRVGVRDRATAALDALGPQTRVAPERRGVITDYLLGQLPPSVSQETRERLAESPSERAWARVLASELTPLASGSLPDIPVDSARREPFRATGSGAPSAPDLASPPSAPDQATAPDSGPDAEPAQARPRSRPGCGPTLGLGLLVAVVVGIVIAANSGGSVTHSSTATAPAASTTPAASTPTTRSTTAPTTPATTASATATVAPATPTTPNGAQLLAQVNLVSATGATGTSGVAQVLKQGTSTGIVIVAQGVAANTSHDAYAVWLYNSPTDSRILGFVNPGVTTDGRLRTAGPLPTDASHFKQLLVTLETQAKPSGPGKVILTGALSLS